MTVESISPDTTIPSAAEKPSSQPNEAKRTASSENTRPSSTHPQAGPNVTRPARVQHELSVSEVISQKNTVFDKDTLILQPYVEELAKNDQFASEFNEMALDLILEFHAWSTARRQQEQHVHEYDLQEDLQKIEKTETEQGMYTSLLECSRGESKKASGVGISSPPLPSYVCSRNLENMRKQMAEYMERMKVALAALTGFNL
ncbi:hypothetical protein CPB83DRAFT_905515 [Crepidotus variabilis]|uniref:Uncharacterized protein n=1 Tax=Crepidotus variabilis TaxID=179855 RepID=A0A9P6JRG5_9AGAR|nr:hypothetical protein CPB83DRAFT_905515 [Crepidotus variabilis]